MLEIEKVIAGLAETASAVRALTVEGLFQAKSGHPGPSLSLVDIITVLYFNEMNWRGDERDRLVLSKGHGVPALYAALCKRGCIDRRELATLRKIDSRLQGHPDMTKLSWLDCGSGALGQGASVAIGYALAARLKATNQRVYCILGDGECQEGQIWEAAMYGGAQPLDNLVFIIDHNQYQNEDLIEKTLPMGSLADKWSAFGWNTLCVDGHDHQALLQAFQVAREQQGRPTMVIAQTVKGKGVSFMEGNNSWHSKAIDQASYDRALSECAK